MTSLHSLTPDLFPPVARSLSSLVQAAGGRAYLVGGPVRDALCGTPVADLDFEIYGLAPERLEQVLRALGPVDAVGRAFSVFKLRVEGREVDVALPRTERKVARGHKGFAVTGDPFLDPREACRRRDFTINAILYDPLSGSLLDFFGGQGDLAAGLLRAVDPATFPEDPLRVYRAAQFAARLGLTIEAGTISLCRTVNLAELPPERVYGEICKILLRASEPSRGFHALRDLGALGYFPELDALVNVPQDPAWHPEGDVWVHTLLALDEAARLRARFPEEADRLALMLGVLCHDLGKPLTTYQETQGKKAGHIVSPDHDRAGEEPTRRLLARLTRETRLTERVVRLVRAHLRPAEYHKVGAPLSAVRRLVHFMEGDIFLLAEVARADSLGRVGEVRREEFVEWLLTQVQQLELSASRTIPPLLLGRDLLPHMPPGPAMGRILKEAYSAQLDGAVTTKEDALALALRLVAQAKEAVT